MHLRGGQSHKVALWRGQQLPALDLVLDHADQIVRNEFTALEIDHPERPARPDRRATRSGHSRPNPRGLPHVDRTGSARTKGTAWRLLVAGDRFGDASRLVLAFCTVSTRMLMTANTASAAGPSHQKSAIFENLWPGRKSGIHGRSLLSRGWR